MATEKQSNNEITAKPVIKWAGGKRQLIPQILELMPANYERYYEPFFGGGALFCELAPAHSTINDYNRQLIDMYKQIKANPDGVCKELLELQNQYNNKQSMQEKDEFYYVCRQRFNEYLVSGCINQSTIYSALLIFLNKAGFNGLYRVNASGLYNVPPAHRKNIKTYDRDIIFAMSRLLQKTRILCGDFEKACKDAKSGDFVFFDPPYYDTFDTYQAGGFSEIDHQRLFGLFKSLSDKGVYCMMTNNNCDYIKDLYKNYNIKVVDVKRMINCDGKNRTGKEVIVTNYDINGGV